MRLSYEDAVAVVTGASTRLCRVIAVGPSLRGTMVVYASSGTRMTDKEPKTVGQVYAIPTTEDSNLISLKFCSRAARP